MQQALHAAAEIDERTELTHRRDSTLEHGADDDGLFHLGGRSALFYFEKRTPGHDEVPAAFFVLADAKRVDLAFVHRRISAKDVDLRERAERALTRDTHFVAALDRLLDPSLDRQPAVEGVLELPHRRRSTR